MNNEFNINLPIYLNELWFWVLDAAAILKMLALVWRGTQKKKKIWKLFWHICDKSYAKSTTKKTLLPLRYPELHIPELENQSMVFAFSLHVFWGIRKELWVLRGWIFRTMRSSMAYNHQYGPVRIHLLWYSKEGNTVIGNQISQIILQVEAKV